MYCFTKKEFVKFIAEPLRVKHTDKKCRFKGYPKEKIEIFMKDEKEWNKFTRLLRGKLHCGVIPFLTDLIYKQPELIFPGFLKGQILCDSKLEITRKLTFWLRPENIGFEVDDRVEFEEKLSEREARSGLSQLVNEVDLMSDEEIDGQFCELGRTILEEEPAGDKEADILGGKEDSDESAGQVLKNIETVQEVADPTALITGQDKALKDAECAASIMNIFTMNGEHKSDSKGGRRQTWSSKFINMALELLADGQCAASVHKYFVTMSKFYPELLEGENRRVPSCRYFERLRDALPALNSAHTKDTILKGDRFVLACDAAAMHDATKSIAVGIINTVGRLHIVDIRRSRGGSAEAVAEQMISIVEDSGASRILKSKVDFFMSDQESAQIRANCIVSQKFVGVDNEVAPPTVYCAIHTSSNACSRSIDALKRVSPNAFILLDSIRSCYGKAASGGFCHQDGRKVLKTLLKERDDKTTMIFADDLGKRFGCTERNAGSLVLFFSTVLKATRCLKFQYEQKKKDEDKNSKFHLIETLVSGQCDGYVLDSAGLFLNYQAFVNDFHKRVSAVGEKALTFSMLKELFKSTLGRIQAVLNAPNPYEELINAARLMAVSEESVATLDCIDSRWVKATALARRKRLNQCALAIVEGTKWKLQKDFDLIKDLSLPDDRKIISTNRALESSFATLKGFQAKIKNLGQEKLFSVATAKYNKLTVWLSDLPSEEREELLMLAIKDKKVQAQERKRKTIEADRESLLSIPKKFR
ncbi:unnamed protein product [Oikopleura dioica]|uniref:Uncharacterized protein n=1 Tax=Oikopleura dioica TaxID=34765 RepID=E4XRW7_OIKDI|nr:unnamed protein product [Oikopleura dioica]